MSGLPANQSTSKSASNRARSPLSFVLATVSGVINRVVESSTPTTAIAGGFSLAGVVGDLVEAEEAEEAEEELLESGVNGDSSPLELESTE